MDSARFTRATTAALEASGWTADREVDISGWLDDLSPEGYQRNDVAEAALKQFGGLVIQPVNQQGPNFTNDEPFSFDPVFAGGGLFAYAEDLTSELGGNWYPLGSWLSFSSVFVDPNGWVTATGLGWIWELGSSIDDAIEFAVRAHRPLRCLATLTPGGEPWPPPLDGP